MVDFMIWATRGKRSGFTAATYTRGILGGVYIILLLFYNQTVEHQSKRKLNG